MPKSNIMNLSGGAWYPDANIKNYCGKWPNASGSPIDTTYMNNNKLQDLKGTVTISFETAPPRASIPLNADNSVRGYKQGENITIYSAGGGGAFAPQNCQSLFQDFQAKILDLNNLDTSNVTNMSDMFEHSRAEMLDLSSFDTGNITNMSNMFKNSNATSIDLNNFNTSNVTNMSGMFSYSFFNSLDFNNFDTRKVQNMSGMFAEVQGLRTLDLSNFNTSNVTNMSYMFIAFGIGRNQFEIPKLDLSSFDTSKVTNMERMFERVEVNTLNLSSFDTSNVINMKGIFNQAHIGEVICQTEQDKKKFEDNIDPYYNDIGKFSVVQKVK